MRQFLWRIGTDTRNYEADDLSGAGARATGGRWNEPGTAVVYAATSRALACPETVVHLNAGGLPFNRYLVELSVPQDLWDAAERAGPDALPVGWDAEPAGRVSTGHGTRWVAETRSALLLVPSVIVPEEWNALLNPAHPDAGQVTARKCRRWLYDPRLGRG